jgi:dipeptidyl aminopeptidase/acylaminoacyl peptidase
MRFPRLSFLAAFVLPPVVALGGIAPVVAQSASRPSSASASLSGYRLPPAEVVKILDAPATPAASFSPDRSLLALTDYQPYPPIALLARPHLKLAGLRVDPVLNGTQRTRRYTGISLLRVADGKKTAISGLPRDAAISPPDWALNSRRFAFTRETPTGLEVWVGDAEKGTAKAIPGLRVADVLFGPFSWMNDSRHLLVAEVPTGRGPAPKRPEAPTGPVMEETLGKFSMVRTYQDLLKDEQDTKLFSYYGSAQIAVVDTETGRIQRIGKPDLYTSVRPSPDEKYLLVTRLTPPFSYRVPYSDFGRVTEVWERGSGRVAATILKQGLQDEVPVGGVSVGPRTVTWQEKKPATLLWAEALDNGDPRKKVPHRDRLMRLAAPFTGSPAEVLKVTHRYAGLGWFDTPDLVLLTESDRDRRWTTTYLLDLNQPETSRRVLFDRSVQDAYNDPGSPVYDTKPNGDRTILQEGDWIYLSGQGASPEGNRPFLRRFHLKTKETTEVFRSDATSLESFVGFIGKDRILTNRQSRTEPPNYYVRGLTDGSRKALTNFADPHPQITGMKKELVKYTREKDGVPLSGTLYLPPDYDPASGKRLPLVMWAYPREYNDASTAGQVRGSTNTFTRLSGMSHLWFVTQGYAVLDEAAMPVIGDPETVNDTFVEQIVGAAKAAIDYLDKRGIIDPKRVVVGGHSYGAFMTANLLAHSDLFAAGIARSGAYNRTLTPFGFQSERRSYWDAPETYYKMSPFSYAHKVKTPILLIHGQDDNNPGTFPVQSERFYQALQANGATARLVMLPHESHGYAARESILHTLAEMFDWADRFAKNRPTPSATPLSGTR